MNSFANEKLHQAFELITDIDKEKVRNAVKNARMANPLMSDLELATNFFDQSRLKAAAAGFGLGVAGNPLAIVPSAIADITITTKTEVFAAACAAETFHEGFLDSETARMELLVPVFGMGAMDQLAAELGIRAGKELTKDLIKKHLSKETLKQFKKIMLKYFGIKATQKGIITKTLPIVGGFIGASWNAIEVSVMKNRVIKYLQADSQEVEVVSVVEEPN
ncbi:hypothetical protein [Synechococcus sp. MIT S1220]|uniref:hypothetical protein n=1 Tax=Synechococcus sp. MIT S1220 TaxID=3082549 RepID=UPI0039AF270B